MNLFVNKKRNIVIAIVVAIGLVTTFFMQQPSNKIDFSADVKPILNKKCISCHGGVKKQGGFSFLFREEALAVTESGKPAIIPGDPDGSEMIRRLTLNDPEERMPYKHDPLSKEEISILKRWIKQGAKWGEHWAYLPVEEPTVPTGKRRFFGLLKPEKPVWVKNEIDYFINEKLVKEKIQASVEADKATLLRRVSLDITGLPPSTSLAQQFLNDTSSNAYERLVDSLLASSHYGERWTALWMDMARYADTKGYERDAHRSIWRYRDWLIQSFNQDKPYNDFLIEQVAGDLLPNPTDAQYIATAFHRNTMTNDEGGTDNEEYRTAAVMDRVSTTWETLMGTTFACVQCHSHPYDPFRHEEYYKFLAFFNNTRDEDTYEDFPVLREYKNVDSLKFEKLKVWLQQNVSKEKYAEIVRFIKTGQPVINSVVTDAFTNSALADTKWLSLRNNGTCRIKKVDLTNRNTLMFRYSTGMEAGKWSIHLDSIGGPLLTTISLKTTKGWEIASVPIPVASGVHDLWFSYKNPNLKKPEENGANFSWFYFTQSFPGNDKPGYDSAQQYYFDLVRSNQYTGTPIMVENTNDLFRTTNVFERGNWMVKSDEVKPGVPATLNPMPANAPANRLGLAMWLTDKKNPLVSRTIVNRIWEQLFGHGLAETLEDLGTQGIAPTHQELLDWLSYKLMTDYNWSLKKLIKEIVLSATYRQSSVVSKELQEKDPANRLYARGPRVRLSAEQLRDQALAVSGLLSRDMYGRSVMPYQPVGIWLTPYNGDKWKMSEGGDQYRRTIYTYWKRSAPYPFMMMFDGAARNVCVARRINTNTPLQALATLNDSSYLNMARNLAYNIKKEEATSVAQQISKGYEHMMYKAISKEKLNALTTLYTQSVNVFKEDKLKACEVIGMDSKHNTPETAALVVVMNAMLNLDEWITKN
ncbi:DUF1553 domain-containing protein [Lacibacter sediminis]|uniref:DUF1553 domain-containing protein n=1 Tax=Lacibacter sediminis TaxID=2760713 RepID=A0A7G5XKV6_9BACT|nr:DUF1553 domain-containing protein [Lacibacter sediminis]QNA46109.1 DUF1553 domain-containing protein [Lacibacter sediminis]